MKPIKKITLKDAKVLSDSELRNITGGYTAPSENGCPSTKDECTGSCTIKVVDYNGDPKKFPGTCGWLAYNGSGSCACIEN